MIAQSFHCSTKNATNRKIFAVTNNSITTFASNFINMVRMVSFLGRLKKITVMTVGANLMLARRIDKASRTSVLKWIYP